MGYPTDLFEASDGGYVEVAAYLPEQWRLFCEAIDRPDLFVDSRFAEGAARIENMGLLRSELQSAISARPRDEWTSRFRASGIMGGPVLAYSEVMRSEHAEQNACFVASECGGLRYAGVRMPARSESYRAPEVVSTPTLGADTEKILAEIGYQADEIFALRNAGIISTP